MTRRRGGLKLQILLKTLTDASEYRLVQVMEVQLAYRQASLPQLRRMEVEAETLEHVVDCQELRLAHPQVFVLSLDKLAQVRDNRLDDLRALFVVELKEGREPFPPVGVLKGEHLKQCSQLGDALNLC